MSAELKQIQITGGAVDDFGNATRAGRKKRTSRKQRKEESSDGKSGPTISKHQGGSSSVTLKVQGSTNSSARIVEASSKPIPTLPRPLAPAPASPAALAPAPAAPILSPSSSTMNQDVSMKGGVKPKVILEAPLKKSQLPKVHLAAPKAKPAHTQTKKARKIRVSLTGLGKRMTRHKSIQKEAKIMPIEKLKKVLIDAKLVKQESKAPESILRQIYADYQTLKNKAL